MELERQQETLRKRGLGVAALSYDSVAILKDFATRRTISFPLLSDPESKVIRAFGLRNEADYPPGQMEHGVPYPGTFVTDARGIVRSKLFERTYVERRTAASFLTLAGEEPSTRGDQASTPHFALRRSASDEAAAPGQIVTLVLEFRMKPGIHAYAPGVERYRPLRLHLDPQPLVTVHEARYPASKPYHFKPLQETVPVFEGEFRVTQDVTLGGARQLADLLKAEDPQIRLAGVVEHQVCSPKVCYPPGKLPVQWTIKLLPLDRERAPEAIQHRPPGPTK